MNLTSIRERVAVRGARLAPKHLYSAAIGWGARRRVPRAMRSPLYRAFARLVGARLDEAELPLRDYNTFGDFFARRLRSGARPIAGGSGAIAAPCDGIVAAIGRAASGRMIQAKGREYQLAELIADDALATRLEGGAYLTVYLAPGDYHRVHAPVAGRFVGYDYVPGALLPVNPLFSAAVDRLLATNERLVLHFDSDLGNVAVVLVGALGVGNMFLSHGELESRQLRSGGARCRVRFDAPPAVERGDEIGAFYLGSTVVVVFTPGRVELGGLAPGDVVRTGVRIGQRFDASDIRAVEMAR